MRHSFFYKLLAALFINLVVRAQPNESSGAIAAQCSSVLQTCVKNCACIAQHVPVYSNVSANCTELQLVQVCACNAI